MSAPTGLPALAWAVLPWYALAGGVTLVALPVALLVRGGHRRGKRLRTLALCLAAALSLFVGYVALFAIASPFDVRNEIR